ncbi:MAG TPA: PGPGW domain-containing protein [Spirillospora sp.]
MGYRRHATRGALAVVGGFVLMVGVALLVLPGPGLLLVLAGLLILARALPAVERFVEPVRVRAIQAAEESVTSWWRFTGSVLTGVALIGAGVLWALEPRLPFSGWSTGAGLVLSGLILFALMIWSHRRVRNRRRG